MNRIKIQTAIDWSKKHCARLLKDHFGLSMPTLKRPTPSYELVFPRNVTSPNEIPDHITPPAYAFGQSEEVPHDIIFKTDVEIPLMRQSCSLAKKILNAAGKRLKVGMTTDELDEYIHKLIINNLAYPSPLRYNGFPKSICTSVNNVACHGIPDDRPLANGDIISVDVTVYYQGYHGDCCATFLVGDVDEAGKRLVTETEKALNTVISRCKPGEPLTMIGDIISKQVKGLGFTVVPSIYGHGIGHYFHEAPPIIHDNNYSDVYAEEEYMEAGMTFTLEPVISEGSGELVSLDDGWTLVTEDDSRTAQFEHTILITKNGAEILTK